MLPHALSQVKGLFSLRFLPPRHSISQHFTVLLMRHAIKRIAAVVEQGGDVTADLPSLQVSPFGMLCLHFVRFSKFTFRPPNFSKLAIDMTVLNMAIYFMHITQCIHTFMDMILCSENATYYYFSITNNWGTRNNSFSSSFSIIHSPRYKDT